MATATEYPHLFGHLTSGVPTLRNMVLSRIAVFYQKLLRSSSDEARLMAEVAAGDAQTVMAGNLVLVSDLCKHAGSVGCLRQDGEERTASC